VFQQEAERSPDEPLVGHAVAAEGGGIARGTLTKCVVVVPSPRTSTRKVPSTWAATVTSVIAVMLVRVVSGPRRVPGAVTSSCGAGSEAAADQLTDRADDGDAGALLGKRAARRDPHGLEPGVERADDVALPAVADHDRRLRLGAELSER